jgi:hypothetical protein
MAAMIVSSGSRRSRLDSPAQGIYPGDPDANAIKCPAASSRDPAADVLQEHRHADAAASRKRG